jgi:hypothetical protein
MFFSSFFHRSQLRQTRHRAHRRHAVRRPRFEPLEDRLTLSYVWDGIYYSEPPPGVVLAPSLPLLADFTSDGIPDQISANYLAYEVAVRPGRGDGTFGDPISSFVRAPKGGASGVADLNSDGRLDVFVVSLWDHDAAWGNVLTGAGNGSFFTNSFPVDFIGGELVLPVAIGTGDLFGTGRTDVVVAGNTEDHSALYVVLANTSPVGPTLPGDYNGNGTVDAADYVMWRKTLGTSMPNYSGADGNGNGVVDQDDHAVWRAHFGQTSPAGAGSFVAAAPEPASVVLFGVGLVAMFGAFFHRSPLRRRHALPTAESGVKARADDLLLVRSAEARFDQQPSESGLNSCLINDSNEEAVETRRAALDIAFTTLNRAAWQLGDYND